MSSAGAGTDGDEASRQTAKRQHTAALYCVTQPYDGDTGRGVGRGLGRRLEDETARGGEEERSGQHHSARRIGNRAVGLSAGVRQ